MKKKIIILIIAFLPFQVSAEVKTYQCGNNCTATLDDNGIMRVSGTGEMWGYNATTRYNTPWINDAGNIRSVIIENGITKIGNWAFFACNHIKTIDLAESVQNIGVGVFDEISRVENITMYDSTVWSSQDNFNDKEDSPEIKINCYGDIDKCKMNFLRTALMKSPTTFAYKGKKIYTVNEAERVSKPTGNTFKLKYK